MPCYTNIGPEKGPYLHRDARGAAIGVLESREKNMPIGMAMPTRWDATGAAATPSVRPPGSGLFGYRATPAWPPAA